MFPHIFVARDDSKCDSAKVQFYFMATRAPFGRPKNMVHQLRQCWNLLACGEVQIFDARRHFEELFTRA